MKPKHELADIIHRYQSDYLSKHKAGSQVLKTLKAIKVCRTAVLGGNKKECSKCKAIKISYNSCRNRHCPKCQAVARERWIKARESELLDVPYFHIVFTLPHEFNSLVISNPKEVYNALFRASWQTIQQLASDPKHLGAKTGMTSVLHTWGQNLALHPHLHCIVPGGGISEKGKWIYPKKAKGQRKVKYLFPKRVMSIVFRAKFMAELRKEISISQSIAKAVMGKSWVVYAKQPFIGPKQVIEYLGRYTHKIAISNHRLVDICNNQVIFKYKNYKTDNFNGQMKLDASEFIRRFCMHILPSGFVRMRHNGILASRNKKIDLNKAKTYFGLDKWEAQKIPWEVIAQEKLNVTPNQCKKCKCNTMEVVQIMEPQRGPPIVRSKMKPNLEFTV